MRFLGRFVSGEADGEPHLVVAEIRGREVENFPEKPGGPHPEKYRRCRGRTRQRLERGGKAGVVQEQGPAQRDEEKAGEEDGEGEGHL